MTHLRDVQRGELDVSECDVQVVELAGLCHDLGHGPFSHVFENELLPRIAPGRAWHHEAMSDKVFDRIIDENYLDLEERYGLGGVDMRRAKALMQGEPLAADKDSDKAFLYDIVANKRNGIDVDKFDYLARDAFYSGVKLGVDTRRLIGFSKVIDNQVCFKWSEYNELLQLFHDRARMHQKVYTHRKAKAIEFMVVDALALAEPVLGVSAKLDSAADFISLDDSLVRAVEFMDPEAAERPADIRQAQALLRRLHSRQLYRFCGEVVLPGKLEQSTEQLAVDIAALAKTDGTFEIDVRADVIVRQSCVDFTAADANPLDRVKFFKMFNSERSWDMDHKLTSQILPRVFQERKLRLYCRDRDERKVEALRAAFGAWVNIRYPNEATLTSTPFIDRRSGTASNRNVRPRLDSNTNGGPAA